MSGKWLGLDRHAHAREDVHTGGVTEWIVESLKLVRFVHTREDAHAGG